MSLVNNGERLYDNFTGELIIPSLVAFETAERRIKEKKNAIADLQNELDLLKQQSFNTYRSEVRYWVIGQETMLYRAQEWLGMLKRKADKDGIKLDRRKNCLEKNAFEYLQSVIGEMLDIKDFKIDEIVNFSLGAAFLVNFFYLDHKWELYIPLVNNVQMRSYESSGADCFQLRLYFYKSPHHLTMVGSTFEEDELKGILQLGIEKYCTEK